MPTDGKGDGGLKEALEMTGCKDAADLIDKANIGASLLERIDSLTKAEGPFKGWAPADDPAEIVYDLVNHYEEARAPSALTEAQAALMDELTEAAASADATPLERFVAEALCSQDARDKGLVERVWVVNLPDARTAIQAMDAWNARAPSALTEAEGHKFDNECSCRACMAKRETLANIISRAPEIEPNDWNDCLTLADTILAAGYVLIGDSADVPTEAAKPSGELRDGAEEAFERWRGTKPFIVTAREAFFAGYRALSAPPREEGGSGREAFDFSRTYIIEHRGPVEHELKTWSVPFRAVESGAKPFEFRCNDRDFREGDTLWLRETEIGGDTYTGRELKRTITYALLGGQFGVPIGYAVLGLAPTPLKDAGARAAPLLWVLRGMRGDLELGHITESEAVANEWAEGIGAVVVPLYSRPPSAPLAPPQPAADRARGALEAALLAALVDITVQWELTPADDDAEGWCKIADNKRSKAQTALAKAGYGIDWNAIGRGERDPTKLLAPLAEVEGERS